MCCVCVWCSERVVCCLCVWCSERVFVLATPALVPASLLSLPFRDLRKKKHLPAAKKKTSGMAFLMRRTCGRGRGAEPRSPLPATHATASRCPGAHGEVRGHGVHVDGVQGVQSHLALGRLHLHAAPDPVGEPRAGARRAKGAAGCAGRGNRNMTWVLLGHLLQSRYFTSTAITCHSPVASLVSLPCAQQQRP